MIVAPECAPAHIRGRNKPKRLLRTPERRRCRSGVTRVAIGGIDVRRTAQSPDIG